ncbi:MAG: RNA-binding S4 domain-containing protein [Bacteroidota bacterium]
MSVDDKIRIDKWLWAARLYKTRSQASMACEQGRILIDDQVVKASRILKKGDIVAVKRTGITLKLQVIQVIEKRVGAKLIPEIYADLTPPETIAEYRNRAARSTGFRDPGTGRPTKKERRALDDFFDPYEED